MIQVPNPVNLQRAARRFFLHHSNERNSTCQKRERISLRTDLPLSQYRSLPEKPANLLVQLFSGPPNQSR